MMDTNEIISLVEKARQGDQRAKEILLDENVLLIKSVIRRFRGKGVENADLFQLGCLGFIKAINNFKPEFGVKFSTYVVPMVMGEIKRFMRDDGLIKVSRSLKSLNKRVERYIAQFNTDNRRNPRVDEIAKGLGEDEGDIVLAMDAVRMPMSMQLACDDDDDTATLGDRIPSNDEDMFESYALKEMISSMPARYRKIIILRYYFDQTQSEIARQLKISQVQVSRLENKILQMLREKMGE